MSPSLRLLLWLRLRGRVRLTARRFGALQSALLTVVAIFMGLGLVGVVLVMLFAGRRGRRFNELLDLVETWSAPMILAGWVVTVLVGSKTGALAFTPADVDQLFPGPYRRREIVLYRICVQSFGALVSGIFAGLWLIMHAGTILGGWLAFVLLMLFLQFSNIAMSIAREAGGTRLRLGVGIPVVAGVAYVALSSGVVGGDFSRILPMLRGIRESAVVSTLLTPLEPFGRAFIAQDTRTALMHVAGCLGLVLLMVVLILRLDAVSLEASMAASQKVQAKLERMRGKRAVFRPTAGVNVPMPTLLGPAAPLVWRHLTGVVRSGAWLLVPLAVVAGAAVGGLDADVAVVILPTFCLMTVFVLPNLLRFDFRADIDQIDLLKTLPLRPVTIAAGQVAAPIVVLSLMTWGVIGAAAVRDPALGMKLLPGALLAPLAGALLMACENILFLLYPYRSAASGVMDVRHLLRGIVSQIAKVITVAGAAAPAALVMWGAFTLGLGWTGAVLASAALLAVECAGLVLVLAWAFNRFDPARDMPA